MTEPQPLGDHPHNDPGDGRTECQRCGKWVHEATHSCKGVPVTAAAWARYRPRLCRGCDCPKDRCDGYGYGRKCCPDCRHI